MSTARLVRCAATTLLAQPRSSTPVSAHVPERVLAVHAPAFCCAQPSACRYRAVERHPDFMYVELVMPFVSMDVGRRTRVSATRRLTGTAEGPEWRGAATLVE